MGLLTFSINVTLDGCVDHQEGIADDETHAFFTRLMDDGGAMLWGRVTYEMMESYWPAVARGDEEAPPAMREWAVADSSDHRNTATLMAGDRSGQRMAVRASSGNGVPVSLDQVRIVAVRARTLPWRTCGPPWRVMSEPRERNARPWPARARMSRGACSPCQCPLGSRTRSPSRV